MVKRNIMFLPKFLLVTILLLLMAGPALSQNGLSQSNHSQIKTSNNKLSVSISNTDKQWGQFLRVTLRYHGAEMLEGIDLQSWRQYVAVSFDDEYIDEDDNGNPIQVLQLRLHPRKTGRFQLPSLKLGKSHSQAIDINISQPIVKNAAIKLDWQISTSSPWQREAVLIRVQLQTNDYAAHIKLDPPEHKQFLSRVLKTERQVLDDGSYRFDAGWILYPMDTGVAGDGLLELDLPPVRYQIAGSDRRQFYLPLQKLQVKALPNYLPPTLPVGKLNVHSQIINDKESNKQWQLSIKTDALIPYGVPELDAHLATISEHDIADVVIKYTQQSNYSDFANNNYFSRSIYSSPMPDWLMPFGNDLKLTLRFFDTETGRLGEISHQLPRRWNMPAWAWWLTMISGFIISAFIFRYLQPWILSQATRLKLRHRLRNAEDIKQMRRMILDCGPHASLTEWATSTEWDKNNQARKKAIHKLNCYCFSSSALKKSKQADFRKLKIELIELV
ncbi:MAG: BatD family protein [Gammaproteobacteria bacterium]|nr:BatD family protein [Gammaproteobacteria bacterium]